MIVAFDSLENIFRIVVLEDYDNQSRQQHACNEKINHSQKPTQFEATLVPRRHPALKF